MPRVKARKPRKQRKARGSSLWDDMTQGRGSRGDRYVGGPTVVDIPRSENPGLGEPKAWVRVPGLEGASYELARRNLYRRPLKWKGAIVNPDLSLPRAPFEGIDEERCSVCGEKSDDFRAGISWSDGADLIRQAARSQDVAGGGWRTRGPVLWAMHYLKVTAFYERHTFGGCMWLWDLYEGQRPIPRALTWACFYGGSETAGGDCLVWNQVKALVDMGRPKPYLWPMALFMEANTISYDVRPKDDQLGRMGTKALTPWEKTKYADALALTEDQVAQLLAVAPLLEAERPTLEDFIDKRNELIEQGVTAEELQEQERAELAAAWTRQDQDAYGDVVPF